jgi:hypothetical protein
MLAVTALPVEVCRKGRESGKGDQVIEKHYTINELAELLTMSFERMRQLVMDEPGVLRIAPKTRESAEVEPCTEYPRAWYNAFCAAARILHRKGV